MGHVFQSGLRSVRGRLALAILIISAIAGASEGIDRLSTAHFIRDIGFPLLAILQPVHWLGAMDIIRAAGLPGCLAGREAAEHQQPARSDRQPGGCDTRASGRLSGSHWRRASRQRSRPAP
jgi:hypothetical protein